MASLHVVTDSGSTFKQFGISCKRPITVVVSMRISVTLKARNFASLKRREFRLLRSVQLDRFLTSDDEDEMGEAFFEAIEELERMTREPSDVLEEMNDKLSARELQLVLVYFSQEGRDSWCALEVFEWLKKENRVDQETMELMVSIMCGWVKKLIEGEHLVGDVIDLLVDMDCVGLKPSFSMIEKAISLYWEMAEKDRAVLFVKEVLSRGITYTEDDKEGQKGGPAGYLAWKMMVEGNYRDAVNLIIHLKESGLNPEVYSYLIAMTAVVKELNELAKAFRKLKGFSKAGLIAEMDGESVRLAEKYQADLIADGLRLSSWVKKEGGPSLNGVVHERLLAMYICAGRGLESERQLWEMKLVGKQADRDLYDIVLAICASQNEAGSIARLLTGMEVTSSLRKKKTLSWLLRGYIKGGHFEDAAETLIKMLDLGLFPEYLDRAAVLHGLRKNIQRTGSIGNYLKLCKHLYDAGTLLKIHTVSALLEEGLEKSQFTESASIFIWYLKHPVQYLSIHFVFGSLLSGTQSAGNEMKRLKLFDRHKDSQVHAHSTKQTSTSQSDTGSTGAPPQLHYYCREQSKMKLKSMRLRFRKPESVSITETLLPYGLPATDLIEPPIESDLKPISVVDTLGNLYRQLQCSSEFEKSLICVEQYSFLSYLGDPKLLRRCLLTARRYAVDVHTKVVLAAWLRYARRDNLLDHTPTSSVGCNGRTLECPNAALVSGVTAVSQNDKCQCLQRCVKEFSVETSNRNASSILGEEGIVGFSIGGEVIDCVRSDIANLSSPLKAMLYGSFIESERDEIDFSESGISVEGMRAVEAFSRTKILDSPSLDVVLELLSFANRFCCEDMKFACETLLVSFVSDIKDALNFIQYGLEERASILVASCLHIVLRYLPNSLYNRKVLSIFCSSEARERLATVGHASFLLYYFLSQVAMENNMGSNMIATLLERMRESATKKWQKALACHQLGCVMLRRQEYKKSQIYFEAAAEAGHVYSMAGVARAMYKQGQQYLAYILLSSLISEYKSVGWLYQERSLYCVGKGKILDIDFATELDPTLSFPYKYRAIKLGKENKLMLAISEINKIIGFKHSPDLLELRAWFFIALEDYDSALRDIHALLTFEPNYMMFYGKLDGNHLVDLLNRQVQQKNQAECWIQLYDNWSSVDDVNSLAAIHQMIVNEPGKGLLWFRQSLLLLRLNNQKAALRSLQLARQYSISEQERLVYEGWILYDTGHCEEALAKADKSISIQRTFESLFLKAYLLADTCTDEKSLLHAIQLLEEALKCPSDCLRKGQALNNLGSIYMDSGKLDLAIDCYLNALNAKHTRAHQGLARVYHLKNERRDAYDEITKLIEKAPNNALAYEKRSEYSDAREMAIDDLNMATRLDPLRTYPYRYRAAVLMDDQRETEAIEELRRAIAFKPDIQMLHLRAAFFESMGNFASAVLDCEAALCLEPNHKETLDLYKRAQSHLTH